jgi:NTP pyrophosphatase (non-canonical NTP hydrolase)
MALTGTYQEVVQEYGAAASGYAHSGEPTVADRLHAATGIQEEAVELAEVVARLFDQPGHRESLRSELLGEMGGVLWYVNYAAHVYGHTLEDVMIAGRTVIPVPEHGPEGSFQSAAMFLLSSARNVASMIRKHAYHGRPMESTDELLQRLFRVWVAVAGIGGSYGVLVREAMDYNLKELEARHGGKSFNAAVYTEGQK